MMWKATDTVHCACMLFSEMNMGIPHVKHGVVGVNIRFEHVWQVPDRCVHVYSQASKLKKPLSYYKVSTLTTGEEMVRVMCP